MIKSIAKRLIIQVFSIISFVLIRCTEFFIHLIGRDEFFPLEKFPWVKDIEKDWTDIRDELNQIVCDLNKVPNFQDVAMDQAYLTQDNQWKTHFFYAYGHACEENCKYSPKTAALLKKIPGLKTAMFSILSPGKCIKPHRGPYAGVLRYHLGLIIPKEKERCRIRVGQTIRHWSEGKSMIFDDSHEHQVWNDTSDVRVVLFVDFLRPLPFLLSQWNKALVFFMGSNPLIRDIVKTSNKWAQRED